MVMTSVESLLPFFIFNSEFYGGQPCEYQSKHMSGTIVSIGIGTCNVWNQTVQEHGFCFTLAAISIFSGMVVMYW